MVTLLAFITVVSVALEATMVALVFMAAAFWHAGH
ncbi:hypothetical protein SAMN05443248_2916 [Bradyrhizobium erythrophlei]|uniref:Uncharacterized protein n=1 Tax=Bradyrhizobium erythrophlei TaxID=1437360 RepID=A0A1M5NB53_9BRAD|nr:hypothetical protein SAMN05443248_2916 [Bradyrhizobium erythrophlei]